MGTGASIDSAPPEFNPNDRSTWTLAHVFEVFKAHKAANFDFGVHYEEFRTLLRAAHDGATSIVDELWGIFDSSGTGIVNVLEVLVGLAMGAWGPNPHARSELIFTVFDFNHNNEIDFNELVICLQATLAATVKLEGRGRIPDQQEAERLARGAFEMADTDHSGDLSRAEFRAWAEEHVIHGNVLATFGLDGVLLQPPAAAAADGTEVVQTAAGAVATTPQNAIAIGQEPWSGAFGK
eukprot:g5883.t1